MFHLKREEIPGIVEAILFASGEPVAIDRICSVLEITQIEFNLILPEIKEKYESESGGIKLLHLGDNLQLSSNPLYINYIRDIMDLKRNSPLSPAALEVLSLVAYNEPVTKAFIEQVRGVDCSGVLGSLTQRGLIEERGRLELPGRPLLYGTTDNFLRCFGISTLLELPPIPKDEDESPKDGDELPKDGESEEEA